MPRLYRIEVEVNKIGIFREPMLQIADDSGVQDTAGEFLSAVGAAEVSWWWSEAQPPVGRNDIKPWKGVRQDSSDALPGLVTSFGFYRWLHFAPPPANI
jgi:hypothetical protein